MVGLTAAQPGAWRADSRALLLLALPLILTNLAYVALTTIDIVVLGARSVAEWDDGVTMMGHAIPPAFWLALRDAGLLPPEAPLPC